MVTEQDKTLKALQTSIQMEIDGKEFYLKASQNSSNELGKKLLRTLAGEEDVHRQNFEKIYKAIQKKRDWPLVDFKPDGGKKLRTIFARASGELGNAVKAPATELDAVKTAMDMENKTYDFYKAQTTTAYNAEGEFYNTVAAEEREHHLLLLDYYEYLKDPAAWFVAKEHPSLDGG